MKASSNSNILFYIFLIPNRLVNGMFSFYTQFNELLSLQYKEFLKLMRPQLYMIYENNNLTFLTLLYNIITMNIITH